MPDKNDLAEIQDIFNHLNKENKNYVHAVADALKFAQEHKKNNVEKCDNKDKK